MIIKNDDKNINMWENLDLEKRESNATKLVLKQMELVGDQLKEKSNLFNYEIINIELNKFSLRINKRILLFKIIVLPDQIKIHDYVNIKITHLGVIRRNMFTIYTEVENIVTTEIRMNEFIRKITMSEQVINKIYELYNILEIEKYDERK